MTKKILIVLGAAALLGGLYMLTKKKKVVAAKVEDTKEEVYNNKAGRLKPTANETVSAPLPVEEQMLRTAKNWE